MEIPQYLAITGSEMAGIPYPPQNTAWMACHFSPYGTGLTNLPRQLPANSLLIVNDRTPIHDHDPVLIAAQLSDCVQQLGCMGVLLDFQQASIPQTAELTGYLSRALPCPVAVSEAYAYCASCAVFLSSPPPDTPLEKHLAPWRNHEIWLEMSLDAEEITLTEQGAQRRSLPAWECRESGFSHPRLHCHYQIVTGQESARFLLWRTETDLSALLEEAQAGGVALAVGLYQEFRHLPMKRAHPLLE